jgi:hypothetical protein
MDDKGINTLCALLCKPGGMIDGPAPAGDGAVTWIPNPGVYVSTSATLCLHFTNAWSGGTICPNMYLFAQYKETKDAYKEPTEVVKLKSPDTIIDYVDDCPEYIAL